MVKDKIEKIEKSQQKQKNNKGTRLLISMILTVIVFIIMVICYNKLTNNEKYVSVVVSKAYIEKGTLVTEENIKDLFVVKKIPESLVPTDCLENLKELDSLIINCDITQNSVVTKMNVQEQDKILANMDEPVALGVQVEEIYNSINGSIRAGDIVDITIVSELDITVIKNVYVLTAKDNTGLLIDKDNKESVATNFDIYIERDIEGWLNRKINNGQIYFTKSDNPDYVNIFDISIEEIREDLETDSEEDDSESSTDKENDKYEQYK